MLNFIPKWLWSLGSSVPTVEKKVVTREMLDQYTEPFSVLEFRVLEGRRQNGVAYSEASVKVLETETRSIIHTAAEGKGSVNALDNALRKVLVEIYPFLSQVGLTDFKFKVLDSFAGTGAEIQVTIESSDGVQCWRTMGVSTSVIEASLIALVDALKYKIIKSTEVPGPRPRPGPCSFGRTLGRSLFLRTLRLI